MLPFVVNKGVRVYINSIVQPTSNAA